MGILQKEKKDILVGYLKPNNELFMSSVVNNANFLTLLSNYVKVTKISVDSKNVDFRKLAELDLDYLLLDIKNFGPMQFILREKHKINIPFILILRSIYYWFDMLVYSIPLIRERDIIIAPSKYAKDAFLKISEKFKIHVIPHCLDIMQIQKTIPHNLEKSRRNISFMGRLAKEKGIGILIDCMPELINKIGDVHLNIIGPLSGDNLSDQTKSLHVRQLERKTRRLGLENYVHFVGLKLAFDKYKILSQSDLFVLPTIAIGETFGISIIEALACGIPVITANNGACREIIRNGENGYLIDIISDKMGNFTVNKQQLTSSVTKVLQGEKQAFKMKIRARESALKYDFHKVMPRLVRLLRRKRSSDLNNCGWGMLRHYRIKQFMSFYREELYFFVDFFGLSYKTYASICNNKKNRSNINLFDIAKLIKMDIDVKSIDKKIIEKVDRELMKYFFN